MISLASGAKRFLVSTFVWRPELLRSILVGGISVCSDGHWLMEERPKETMDALVKFLTQ